MIPLTDIATIAPFIYVYMRGKCSLSKIHVCVNKRVVGQQAVAIRVTEKLIELYRIFTRAENVVEMV